MKIGKILEGLRKWYYSDVQPKISIYELFCRISGNSLKDFTLNL